LVQIRNCSGISSFGSSGNYKLFNASVPMVDVRGNSKNVTMLGMVRATLSGE
jgi:hypothetical protein